MPRANLCAAVGQMGYDRCAHSGVTDVLTRMSARFRLLTVFWDMPTDLHPWVSRWLSGGVRQPLRLLPQGLCEGQRHELVFSSSNVAEADVASATQLLVA